MSASTHYMIHIEDMFTLFYVYIHCLYDKFPNLFVVCSRDKK